MSVETFRIESMAFGGAGIARHNELVYFIEGASEGQLVTIKNLHMKKKFAKAEVEEIVEQVDYITDSNCEYFETCGGCQWLDKSYEKQLQWKASFVQNALKRIGRLNWNDPIAVVPSPTSRNYRQRIRVNIEKTDSKSIRCGFYASYSHELVDISKCQIAVHPINGVLAHLSQGGHSDESPRTYSAELHALSEDKVAVTLYLAPSDRKMSQSLIKFWTKIPGVDSCNVKGEFEAENYLYDSQFGVDFYSKPGIFQQVNLAANRIVRDRVAQFIKSVKARDVLDLFCGTGNLSLGVAKYCYTLTGVEYSREAIETANWTAAKNNLTNTKYIPGNASSVLKVFLNNKRNFDVIIVDPPREGMADCVDTVMKLNPQYIIYMSCDPNTLARDLSKICESEYEMISIECFDFFPNTFHVESLAILKKKL